MTRPTEVGEDPFEAGLRAGYAHGYDVGLAHGRAEVEDGLELVEDAEAARAVLLGGPSRDELIARGYIPRDHTRPPALPARLWDADDWAKVDHRDLPTTDHGRAQWREALAVGRVPPHLIAGHAEPRQQSGTRTLHPAARSAAELGEQVTRDVADSGRAVTDARTRLDRTATATAHEPPARHRVADTGVLEFAHGDRGFGR